MKNMTRALSMMLTVTMALVCFTGCGNSDTAGKPAAGTAADAASSPAGSGEKVTLTYWGWDSNFYKPVMEAFKKERSNVEFEVTPYGLLLASLGSCTPEVFMVPWYSAPTR